jgi:hypothetical protein
MRGSFHLVENARGLGDAPRRGKIEAGSWEATSVRSNERSKGCSLYQGRFTWLKMREGWEELRSAPRREKIEAGS